MDVASSPVCSNPRIRFIPTRSNSMTIKQVAVAFLGVALPSTTAFAQHDEHAHAIPRIDHAFVILMENHHYSQIIGNANAPFINGYAQSANLATNYYAVGHPSLTNYLEIVGGSNFGIINDDVPDWHNTSCVPNIVSTTPADESAAQNT